MIVLCNATYTCNDEGVHAVHVLEQNTCTYIGLAMWQTGECKGVV